MNPLYLLINHANGYIEEKGVNKYLIFDSTDENKELLKKYNDVFNGIRDKIKEVSSDECDYEKDYMKIRFNSDDDLPLDKPFQKAMSFNNVAVVYVEGIAYRIHSWYMSIDDAINIINGPDLTDKRGIL